MLLVDDKNRKGVSSNAGNTRKRKEKRKEKRLLNFKQKGV